MIIAAAVWIGLTWCLVVAAPGYLEPMFPYGPGLIGFIAQAMPAIAASAQVVGFAWMIRIHRADPEPYMHAWRYRAGR